MTVHLGLHTRTSGLSVMKLDRPLLGLPWWLRWYRICLQCGRPEFDPWIQKIPWWRQCNPLQYSCLESSMDRGAWRAIVHGIAESDRIEQLTHTYTHTHTNKHTYPYSITRESTITFNQYQRNKEATEAQGSLDCYITQLSGPRASPLACTHDHMGRALINRQVQFSSVQSLSRVQLFATPWVAACQASLSITNSWSLLKPMGKEGMKSRSWNHGWIGSGNECQLAVSYFYITATFSSDRER